MRDLAQTSHKKQQTGVNRIGYYLQKKKKKTCQAFEQFQQVLQIEWASNMKPTSDALKLYFGLDF